VPHDISACVVTWRLRSKIENPKSKVSLVVRPLLSGRDYHSLHHENASFRMEAEVLGGPLRFRPALRQRARGRRPLQRGRLRARAAVVSQLCTRRSGHAASILEDLASPGTFRFDLVRGRSSLDAFFAEGHESSLGPGERRHSSGGAARCGDAWREMLRRSPERSVSAPRRRGCDGPGWLPVVQLTGSRHVHLAAGLVSRHGTPGGAGQILLEWAGRSRRDVAQSLPLTAGKSPSSMPSTRRSGSSCRPRMARPCTPSAAVFRSMTASA
jgi:hypothetical protein